jgi:hypothetical protein
MREAVAEGELMKGRSCCGKFRWMGVLNRCTVHALKRAVWD